MKVSLDHVLWAVPERDAGMALFERLTGVAPVIGGAHPGFGTRNALSSLSADTYLEILAPDPAQDLTGTWGADVAALSAPCMYTFCLACDDLEQVAARASATGVTVEAPIAMSRRTPEGDLLQWRIMRMRDDRWPGRLPFFIDWGDTPHPGKSTPGGTRLTELYVLDVDPAPLSSLFRAIECAVPVHAGAAFGLVASYDTPKGKVVLT